MKLHIEKCLKWFDIIIKSYLREVPSATSQSNLNLYTHLILLLYASKLFEE